MKSSTRLDLEWLGYDVLSREASHPGLWFDRYLWQQLERKETPPKTGSPNARHVGDTAAIKPKLYAKCYERWRQTLEALGTQPRVFKTEYRLAAGHGSKNATETGIALHHSYGVPYIPGSSLKGVAAAFAEQRLDGLWGPKGDAYKTLFGTIDEAGYVTFLDALPLPSRCVLLPDVLTVHHRDYYQARDNLPPADWDSPTPISFLSARGEFLVALLPATGAEAWAEVGYRLLQIALAEMGVGGKTSSGYGRMVALGVP